MADQVYDAIVVGAGVEGSATAFQLRRRGVRVLLLEQFPLPHSRGSSHGQSRITRKAYAEPFYTRMMEYCTHQWQAIQAACGQPIFKKIGFMVVGEMRGSVIKDNQASMEKNGADHEVLTSDKFRARFPALRYGDNWGSIYDPEGGILMADKAVGAYQSLFVKMGGHLRDGEPVTGIRPGEIVEVSTAKGTYRTKSLVLCCGAWTNKVLRHVQLALPLKPVRIGVYYWPETVPGTYSADKLPCFMGRYGDEEEQEIYGLPSFEYPGNVKICLHQGPAIDPDSRDDVDGSWAVGKVKDYVRDHFPGLKPEPSIVEACIYTWTPDSNFILDRHPAHKNIVVGAGFSGHGFKLSPAVGQILADLALELPPQHDISHFRMDRFPPQPTSGQKARL